MERPITLNLTFENTEAEALHLGALAPRDGWHPRPPTLLPAGASVDAILSGQGTLAVTLRYGTHSLHIHADAEDLRVDAENTRLRDQSLEHGVAHVTLSFHE